MKKVLLIIASHGFQPKEYGLPKEILSQGGVQVFTASDQGGVAISSISNDEVKVDIVLDDVKVEDYDGVFVIGGPGALEYLDNEKTYRIVRQVFSQDILCGAICISPRILASAGILKDKKATGWDSDNQLTDILLQAQATYIHEPVVKDGKIITANGPQAAEQFGQIILSSL